MTYLRTHIIVLVLLLLSNNVVFSQKTQKYTNVVGVNIFKGFIYLHTNKIGNLINQHPVGAEIYFNRLTNGSKSWESVNNYPEVGYSIGYYDYRNEVLGKTISTLVHIQYSLLKHRRPHNLKIHVGTGLGFNTNPYNQDTNNKNTILGSTVTFAMQGRVIYTYTLSRWQFSIAPNLTHFSNGSLKQPNKGVNIFTLQAGIARIIGDDIDFRNENTTINFDRKLKVNLALYTGMINNSEGGGIFPFVTFHSTVSKQFTPQSGVHTGLELFYSLALKERIENDIRIPLDESPDFKRLGWVAGYEWFISRVSIIFQVGYYVYRPYKEIPPFYQRLGMKIYTGKSIFFAANLKTHAATAEMAEFGLGVQF